MGIRGASARAVLDLDLQLKKHGIPTALSVTSLLDLASAQAFRDDEKQWDEENSEHGRCDHAAKNRRSHGVAGGGAGAMRNRPGTKR